MSGAGLLLGVDAAPAGGGGSGPWAIVSHTKQQGSASSTSPSIDTTGATILVVVVAWYNGSAAPTLTDSKSNTFSSLTAATGGTGSLTLFYCLSPTVGAGHTVTVHSSQFFSFCVAAFSGGGSSQDQSNGAGSASATSIQPGSVTPGINNELLATGVLFTGTNGDISGAPSGYTLTDDAFDATTTDFSSALAFLNQGSAAASNPTWTGAGSADRIAAAIATFKP